MTRRAWRELDWLRSLSPAQRWAGATAALVVLVMLLWAPILAGNSLFGGDRSRWVLPALAVVREALAHHELPVWNRYVGLGFATTNDPLYGFGYPLNWLMLLGDPSRAQSLVAGLHVLIAGLATMGLARLLGAGLAGSFVAGVGFAFSGVTISLTSAGLLLHAAALAPCVALAMAWALRSPRHPALRLGVAAFVAGGALLQGEVFVWCMAALVGAVVSAAAPASPDATPRSKRVGVGVVMASLALGVTLASAMTVPVALGARESERGGALPLARAEIGSLHPLRILEFAAPGAYFPLGQVDGARPVVGERRLNGRNLIESVYLGAALLALALCAPGRGRRRENLLAAATFALLLVAMGHHTPAHRLWRLVLVPFSRMRFPERYMIPVALLVALLAGLGLRRLRSEEGALRWPPALLALALTAASFVVPWAFGGAAHSANLVTSAREACVTGATAAFLLALAAWWSGRRPTAATVGVVAVVTLDLFLRCLPLVESAPASLLDPPRDGARTVLADARLRREVAPPRVLWSERMLSGFANGLSAYELEYLLRRTLMFSTPSVWGIATVNPYDVGLPPSWQRVWDRFRRNPWPLLRFTGARWIVFNDLVEGGANVYAHDIKPWQELNPGVLAMDFVPSSRVFLAHEVRVVTGDHPERALDESVTRGALTLVSAPLPRALSPATGPEGCALVTHRATRVVFDCVVTAPALAVAREQFHPGWSATVDAVPAPILRANTVMRAVLLSPGRHRVVMTFRAPGLRAGVTISALALLACLSLVGYGAWRSRVREGRGEQ